MVGIAGHHVRVSLVIGLVEDLGLGLGACAEALGVSAGDVLAAADASGGDGPVALVHARELGVGDHGGDREERHAGEEREGDAGGEHGCCDTLWRRNADDTDVQPR